MNLRENKVLDILEENCRLPANQIAKRVRISPEGVINILQRLEKEKIILRYNTKVNYSIMGYGLYPVYIKLSKKDKATIKRIKDTLNHCKTCAWYNFCEGEYDLMLSFKISNDEEKYEINKALQELNDIIQEKEFSTVLYAFEIGKDSHKIFTTLDVKAKKANLAKEDLAIIGILRKNAREPILKIAKEVSLSPRIVSQKIKKLQSLKVISGFKTKINTSILNYQPCIALISLNKYSEQEINKFINYCKTREGINYYVELVGKYDIELTIDSKNTSYFYNLIDEIRNEFHFIKKITTLISKETS
jgi:DNA-binding Lrp family transcriptional regulator